MPRKERTKTQKAAAARKSKAHAIWLADPAVSLKNLASLTGVSRTTLSAWRKDWAAASEVATAAPPPASAGVAPGSAPFPSQVDPEADALTQLVSLRTRAVQGLEQLLGDPSTPPATRLSATRDVLSLSGVVPPKRGSTQMGDEACQACAARGLVRRHLRDFTVGELEQLRALLLRVTGGAT